MMITLCIYRNQFPKSLRRNTKGEAIKTLSSIGENLHGEGLLK